MPARAQRFTTTIPELRRLAAWARGCATEAGATDEMTYRIELCLHEAAANIIEHGNASGTVKEFDIEFEEIGARIRFTLIDEAPPFDPRQYPALRQFTSIEDAPDGGFGIHLMRSFASALDYRREAGRNVFTLWFTHDGNEPAV